MAVRVRQYSYNQEPIAPQQQEPLKQPKPKKKKVITAKEKLLYIAFVVVVACISVTVLHKQSSIQQVTIEIQQIETEIAKVEEKNVDLKVQVGELSTYERIWEKAKALGLTLNEKNVKVVPGE